MCCLGVAHTPVQSMCHTFLTPACQGLLSGPFVVEEAAAESGGASGEGVVPTTCMIKSWHLPAQSCKSCQLKL